MEVIVAINNFPQILFILIIDHYEYLWGYICL
jgi:hypothetical protein